MTSSKSPLQAFVVAAVALVGASLRAGEVVREQDAAGRVRVIREVTEDAHGNCINHGLWQLLDEAGRVCGEGRYDMGRRAGEWCRWLAAREIPPELAASFAGFKAPILSRATFAAGRMTGAWTIVDAHGHIALSVEFVDGRRHGMLRILAPDGQVIRAETFAHGRLDGEALAWSAAQQRLVHAATWVHGYRLVRSVAFFHGPASTKRAEGEYLLGPTTLTAADDFWACRLAAYEIGDACIPHGAWRAWGPGGQLAAEGSYAWGRPVGEFVWRHPNGQKATAGSYDAAGRPLGSWRWWNADGLQVAVRNVAVAPPGSEAGRVASQIPVTESTAVR